MPTDKTRPMDSGDGKPYTKGFSEHGRGGTKPTPGIKLGARYVYYRLYTKDGPLESNSPIYSNDHFISRIVASSVRPPQTAASLMRHLCKIEGLALQNCILFQSLSDMTALDDSIRLSLQGTSGSGASDLDPMALVVDKRAAERRSQVTSAVKPRGVSERDYDQHYVYYRVYDDDGEIASKTSFDEDNPFLGRVDSHSVPPPHTVSSLKHFIIKSEDISGHNVQLFEDGGSDSAMNNSDALTLLSDKFPGCIEDRPITITYDSGMKNGSADTEDLNEIQTRELREALAQVKKEFEEANLIHTRELEAANRTHARGLAEVSEGWKKDKETHARELEEANRIHLRELAEVREGWEKAKGTHTCELEEANRTHARELAEVREGWRRAKETHARELEEANRTHARELAEVREGWKKVKETPEGEIFEAQYAMLKAQSIALPSASTFTKILKAKHNSDWSRDLRWHSLKTGDIFYTDGISGREKWCNNEYDCYLATNSSGKLAFVGLDYTEFC